MLERLYNLLIKSGTFNNTLIQQMKIRIDPDKSGHMGIIKYSMNKS